jgi:hypothetical protein
VPFAQLFFELAVPPQADGRGAGYVGQITANSFMKREFGKKLITHFFAAKVDLTHVIDTSGAYIPGHGTPTAGSLRSWVIAGHCLDEVVWAAVGVSGGAGDVGLAGGAVIADGGATQGCEDGWSGAGPGLVQVFTERHVSDVMDPVFDEPFFADPVLQVAGVGVGCGQRHGERVLREPTRFNYR